MSAPRLLHAQSSVKAHEKDEIHDMIANSDLFPDNVASHHSSTFSKFKGLSNSDFYDHISNEKLIQSENFEEMNAFFIFLQWLSFQFSVVYGATRQPRVTVITS